MSWHEFKKQGAESWNDPWWQPKPSDKDQSCAATLPLSEEVLVARALLAEVASSGASRQVVAAVASCLFRHVIGMETNAISCLNKHEEILQSVEVSLGPGMGISDVGKLLRKHGYTELAKSLVQEHRNRKQVAHPSIDLSRRLECAFQAIGKLERSGKPTSDDENKFEKALKAKAEQTDSLDEGAGCNFGSSRAPNDSDAEPEGFALPSSDKFGKMTTHANSETLASIEAKMELVLTEMQINPAEVSSKGSSELEKFVGKAACNSIAEDGKRDEDSSVQLKELVLDARAEIPEPKFAAPVRFRIDSDDAPAPSTPAPSFAEAGAQTLGWDEALEEAAISLLLARQQRQLGEQARLQEEFNRQLTQSEDMKAKAINDISAAFMDAGMDEVTARSNARDAVEAELLSAFPTHPINQP